jgi:hypothetical protein
MEDDTMQKLTTVSVQLQQRALELSRSGQDTDTAMLMSALAVTMEAVRSIEETVHRLDGLHGLGAAGS